MKIAFITGVTGQDGSYLSELLLSKEEYKHVIGLMRRTSKFDTESRIDGLRLNPRFKLKYGDVTDSTSLIKIIQYIKTLMTNETILEIYHLAAQSHVQVSFDLPEYTGQVDALGTLKLLESIKICDIANCTRFYNATTSELFGKVQEVPQTETTPFYPRSPYAVAKLYSYWIAKNYREAYGMFICNGILFNHTSSRRGENFVCRKITIGAAKIKNGIESELILGNLDSQRDIGHAQDYVYGMWLMLQHDKPDDYILSTGKMYKIREIVDIVFKQCGYDIEWKGSGINEVGIDKNTGKTLIRVDEKYFRPSEVNELLGDAKKAKNILKWEPKYDMNSILIEMIKHDISSFKRNE